MNKKANPTRNKLLKAYDMTLRFSDGTSTIVDRCVWENKGAGRDWYVAQSSPVGLKMYIDSPQYVSNETEWRLYQANDVVRANAPKMYGHFLVDAEEHNCLHRVRLNVLVQEKVGATLGEILVTLCRADSWNPATKAEVLSVWQKLLELTDNLASSQIGWWNDFHVGNVNMSLCGGHMLWVDLEAAANDRGHVDNMRSALKALRMYIDLPGPWQVFHVDLIANLQKSLDDASKAVTGKGWWKALLCEELGACSVPAYISTSDSAAAASGTNTAAASQESPSVHQASVKEPVPALWLGPAPWTQKPAAKSTAATASGTNAIAASQAPWTQKPAAKSTAATASGTNAVAASQEWPSLHQAAAKSARGTTSSVHQIPASTTSVHSAANAPQNDETSPGKVPSADPRGSTPTGTAFGSGQGVAPTTTPCTQKTVAEPTATATASVAKDQPFGPEKDVEVPTTDCKKPRVHFLSDPVGNKKQNHRPDFYIGDEILIQCSDFSLLLFGTHSRGLSPDDGIVGKASRISPAPCGGCTFSLYAVSLLSSAVGTRLVWGVVARRVFNCY